MTADPHSSARRRSAAAAPILALAISLAAMACTTADADPAAAPPALATIAIPAGPFVAGSDRAERDTAYLLDQAAYGHDVTRRQGWYEGERPRGRIDLRGYAIATTPVSNAQYARFLADTGHPAPDVGAVEWAGYGLNHPFERTRRHAWHGDKLPAGRAGHPVVLVSHADARAFAVWLSERTGQRWRLPTELEWEKAARGIDGRRFPWGDEWAADRLNSADSGPFDTVPVGSHPAGASPLGLLDAAGQVFEWTATPAGEGRFLVKGGSWDDRGCGVCRPAARHGRPEGLKHILIGFRLVRDPA